MTSIDPSLQDRYLTEQGPVFLTGVQALVRFIIDKQRRDHHAGNMVRKSFISGYEGSPLGGLDLEIRRNLHLLNTLSHSVHQAGVNEKTAAAAVHGSQFIGDIDGFWYGKAHGVKWALDEFSLMNMAGTGQNSGVVLFAGDDHMAKSSGYPASSEQSLKDARAVIFYPSSVNEILIFAQHALALSRYSGLVCALKLVTPICDGAETITVNPESPQTIIPEFTVNGQPYKKSFHPVVIATSAIPYEAELNTVRLEIAQTYARLNRIDSIINGHLDSEIGIIATGKCYPDVMQALIDMGLQDSIPILKMGMIYPIDTVTVCEFAGNLSTIIVVEEKGPFVEEAVAHVLIGSKVRAILGKKGLDGTPLIPAHGELNPDLLIQILSPVLESYYSDTSIKRSGDRIREIQNRPNASLLRRAAHYCPGCPHSISAKAPPGEIAGGEIGCSSLDAYIKADGRGVQYIPTMGLGGAINNGMFPFNENKHLFQNIGDGTVLHSGLLTIFSSISHGANVTYKILWNHVVAMTGGQDITGQPDMDKFLMTLLGMGINQVRVVGKDAHLINLENTRSLPDSEKRVQTADRDQFMAVQNQLAAIEGVNVLIFDQECATESRRRRKREQIQPTEYIYINEEVCEGCGDCGQQSMCLALSPVDTEYGSKMSILQSACNQDLSCIKGDCPSFTSVEVKGNVKPAKPVISPLDSSELPDPLQKVDIDDSYSILIIGIGGTGVVTVAHLLGFAAMFEGKKVNELNRTGLAQKGGPVESPVIIGESETPLSSYIPSGTCDLYLAADIVGAINPANLQSASSDRTVAVVSRSNIPTSEMIYNPQMPVADVDDMAHQINQYTRADENVFVDAQMYAMKLFGNHIVANIFHLGVAYQAGRIPLNAESIEMAIRLNGQAIEMNLQAFRWGRMAIVDPDRLDNPGGPKPVDMPFYGSESEANLPASLRKSYEELKNTIPIEQESFQQLWTGRIADLIAYQNLDYAEHYAKIIAHVYEADKMAGGEEHHYRLTYWAAFMLYKLMAYKDEYEVARLLTGPSDQKIRNAFDGPVAISYYLHPPILRERGLKNKLRFGPWFRPVLKLMARGKWLRGRAIDPFGQSLYRRNERALIDWYESIIEEALEHLSPVTYPEIVDLIRLPDGIRGYESVKQKNIDRTKQAAVDQLRNIRIKRESELTVEDS